ncbi:unnamed protein product [Closterium sp. NIES-54]
MALHHGAKEVVWLRRLLEEIRVCQKEPTVIFCDNNSAVKLSKNACLHVLTKHIRHKWHWVRRLLDKEVRLEIVKTHQQAADILTKRLAESEHWKGMKLAGMSACVPFPAARSAPCLAQPRRPGQAAPPSPSRAAQATLPNPSRAALPHSPAPPSRPAATTAAAPRATAAGGGGASGSAGCAAGAIGAGGATGSAGGAAGAGGAGPATDRHCLSWPLSRPSGGGFGFMGTAQRWQQHPQGTFSLQRLRDCASQRCVPGCVEAAALGSSESVAAPGASESAAALGAHESADALGASASTATGPASAEALHTFTLDSGASRCFFRDCTTITPLATPVPVSLADPTREQDVWVDSFILGGQRVVICPSSRTGRHLATFTRQHASGLYILTTASARVAKSGQVATSSRVSASGQLAASCSCRVLSHQTLLWHHRLGHPLLPCLRSMHSRLLVSGLPRSLPSLPRSPALPCLPCVEGQQRAAPRSSDFPSTTAPLQTLHMDEVACTSMIHAAAPHFLWPFAVRYAAHQLKVWPRVSEPETSPTLRWTGKVGDVLVFRVWGVLSLVRDAKASKLSSCTLRCVFPTDAPPWQFYHPRERRVFSSQGVTFDDSVCFYRLHPHASHPVPLAALFLGLAPSGVSRVDPPPLDEPVEISSDSSGPVDGGDPAADNTGTTRRSPPLETHPGFPPRPSSPPHQPAAAAGDTGGEGFGVAETEGEGSGCAATGGADSGPQQHGLLKTLSPQQICAWIIRQGSLGGGGCGAASTGATSPGGTAGAGGAGGVGGTGGAAGAGGAGATCARGTGGAAGTGGARGTAGGAGGAAGARGAGAAGANGAGGAAGAGDPRVTGGGGTGAAGAGVACVGGAGAAGAGAGQPQQPGLLETLSLQQIRAWIVRRGSPGGGGYGAASTRAASPGGTAGTGGAGGTIGGTVGGAAGTGGAGGTSGGARGVAGAGCAGAAGAGCAGGAAGAGGPGVAGAGGAASTGGARAAGARGAAGAGGTGAAGAGAASVGGAGAAAAGGATGAGGTGDAGAGAAGAGAAGARGAGVAAAGGVGPVGALRHLLGLLPTSTEFPVAGTNPPLLFPPTDQSQPRLLPHSPLPAPAPYTEVTYSLTERREPETRASTPERRETESRASVPARVRRVRRPRAPAVPCTHDMTLLVTDPTFSSPAASALVVELVDLADAYPLDYFASFVSHPDPACPPSVGGEVALGYDVLDDRQEELECLAATVPHLTTMLLTLEGDPDALDIPTSRSYREEISGEYSSQWQTAMDVEMASWKSTGTYVDEVPPPTSYLLYCLA